MTRQEKLGALAISILYMAALAVFVFAYTVPQHMSTDTKARFLIIMVSLALVGFFSIVAFLGKVRWLAVVIAFAIVAGAVPAVHTLGVTL